MATSGITPAAMSIEAKVHFRCGRLAYQLSFENKPFAVVLFPILRIGTKSVLVRRFPCTVHQRAGPFFGVAFKRPRCMPSLPCGVCHLVRPLIGWSTIEREPLMPKENDLEGQQD